ncbi:polyphosphate polymerase domain-containing protein [Glutamicibacter sp.]|uniref:polyphosphate polymerase domain-containing protein n=1 Tax=Glutamicibacter sp. TaxID=1931995 RepID=UPI0028BD985D|nr:polyphosphate polymerase domain-containing protein [Glutamicibacter sp.]
MNWAADQPGISLEELNETAALQTRTDRKYILSITQAQLLLPLLATGSRVLSINEQRSFSYASVYFDTPRLDSYHLAAHPRRRRFKIRTRSYMDSKDCYLEVKTEGARAQTVKERVEHDFLSRHALNAEASEYIATTLAHDLGSCPINVAELSPVIESSYDRTTLYLAETNSRVTIDEKLLWNDPRSGMQLRCNEVIVETKSALNAGPADKLLWRHGIRPSRISKFATGLSLIHEHLPSNRWHHSTKHKITTQLIPQP